MHEIKAHDKSTQDNVSAMPDGAHPDLQKDVMALRADFGRLSDSVSEMVKAQAAAAASSIRDRASAASGKIAGAAADLGQSASDFTSGAQKSLKSATGDLEASVEQNPLAAVIVAAGIGMALGLLVSRS